MRAALVQEVEQIAKTSQSAISRTKSVSYVMIRDLRLLMSGLGGCVMGRMGLGPPDSGVDRGPSTCSSASEEPPSRL